MKNVSSLEATALLKEVLMEIGVGLSIRPRPEAHHRHRAGEQLIGMIARAFWPNRR